MPQLKRVRRDALLTVGKPSRLALWGHAPDEEGKAGTPYLLWNGIGSDGASPYRFLAMSLYSRL